MWYPPCDMHPFVALLAAEGHKPPPLIDVDGTLLVQLGIFFVLFVGLRRFVFLPYLELRRDQHANIEGAKQEADGLSTQTEDKIARYERRLLEAREAAAGRRLQTRAEGESQAQDILANARRRADERLERARTKLSESAPATELALRTKADSLARAIATRVLGREI